MLTALAMPASETHCLTSHHGNARSLQVVCIGMCSPWALCVSVSTYLSFSLSLFSCFHTSLAPSFFQLNEFFFFFFFCKKTKGQTGFSSSSFTLTLTRAFVRTRPAYELDALVQSGMERLKEGRKEGKGREGTRGREGGRMK